MPRNGESGDNERYHRNHCAEPPRSGDRERVLTPGEVTDITGIARINTRMEPLVPVCPSPLDRLIAAFLADLKTGAVGIGRYASEAVRSNSKV
jgi:hypothetical protein